MIVIGAFRHSLDLEQALSLLEKSGIPRGQLLVVAMDGEPDVPMPYSSRTKDLHSQAVELGFACATGLAVIGASTGFIAPWGPIIGGLAASLLGFGLGFGIRYLYARRRRLQPLPKNLPEVTVIVRCAEHQSPRVLEIMWSHQAMTVGMADA